MMDVDHYEVVGQEHPATADVYEDPYAGAAMVYDDDAMNLDEMPVTQEDAWAVIRCVWNGKVGWPWLRL